MQKKTDTLVIEGLVEKNLIGKREADALVKEAESSGMSLQEFLITRRMVPENEVLAILSEKMGLVRVNLRTASIEKQVLEKVPMKIASYYKFFPYKIEERVLTVAVSSPLDIKKQDEIRTQLGLDIRTVLAPAADILDALRKYYGLAAQTLGHTAGQSDHPRGMAQARHRHPHRALPGRRFGALPYRRAPV